MKQEHKEVVQEFDTHITNVRDKEIYRLKMAELAAEDVKNNAG